MNYHKSVIILTIICQHNVDKLCSVTVLPKTKSLMECVHKSEGEQFLAAVHLMAAGVVNIKG